MEKLIMRILGLKVSNLHGHIDYSVRFNDDITFLYGDNGCGKTTILNIITHIITGRVYELFRYKFTKIVLEYVSTNTQKTNNITISYNNDYEIIVEFLKEKVQIDAHRFDFMNRNLDENEEVDRFYLTEYPILNDIKETFNYIYLPLNRNGTVMNDYHSNMRYRKLSLSRYTNQRNRLFSNMDLTLLDVENLIKTEYNKVNFILNNINEQFSDEILKSFLDIENISDVNQIINFMNQLDDVSIAKIQNDYTEVLKSIKKWDTHAELKINSFFTSLTADITRAKTDFQKGVSLELLFKLSELTKISNIISKAEKSEQSKRKTKQPLDLFVETINMFIRNSSSKKEIYIDAEGTILLKTSHNKKVDIQHLSSGEKQIVTFFAYLIFGLKTTNQSIFIVDEPELSLHLKWQRRFVDAIMSINPKVQLIFATHAPEIIGKYRDRTVKLTPNM